MRLPIHILTLLIATFPQLVCGQTPQTDTVFIRKDSLKGFSQSIYIETNKSSKFYDNISAFTFGPFDKESFDNSLQYLKTNSLNLKKKKPVIKAIKWVTLKQYHGKFYAYHPCDFYSYYQVSINDSAYIEWTGEGPVANKISNQKKVNNSTYEFNISGLYEPQRKVTVYIVDKTNGIAIFKETTDEKTKDYHLMIMAEKIKSVPLIVNNCEKQKQSELNFEEPDFELILSKKEKLFDSVQVANTLLTFPKQKNGNIINENIVKAIVTVDKYYRQIADTLYYYKSLKHTIFQTILIETNDDVYINPLSLDTKILLTNIIFSNNSLNSKVDSISKGLKQAERKKLYKYLLERFDNFSVKNKKLNAQPVRLKYIKFPDEQFVHIGIDIFGSHFLWTIDRNKKWEVVKVEKLWVY